ncbi:Met32p NDAI_0C05210 [Naumovozyma dairenensis CBS 421]|uniref:C2H2-type domain-containing protein n=1 Tax=Naumovozyma dairenensis (strain ATCC 10597 / BCRC 20456 / CBS 421 / NBRC 0211 / NRRL Y-12639) TaxID=1071378 RepID=G0W8R9_NAUDC|nr:hypothetical protein NDAI_0C05210 [Naumovozyma dairenensis CBS 421]CCD24180.1 hypothetical protein NDAI_0C05210 [Naumovozyma dairenensis CBS 421]
MDEDSIFFRQAAEAIVTTTLNISNVDPTIRELLNRIKIVTPLVTNSTNVTYNAKIRQKYQDNNYYRNKNEDNKQTEKIDVKPTSSSEIKKYEYLLLDLLNKNSVTTDTTNNLQLQNSNSDLKIGNDKNSSPKPKLKSKSNSKSKAKENDKEKEFKCTQCSLIFSRSSDLRRHEKTHLPILPNICSQCGKGFARKDALKRHFNTLTCKRNRKKLLNNISQGDFSNLLQTVRLSTSPSSSSKSNDDFDNEIDDNDSR